MARYLITGGAGFIGSHLAERLLKDGHSVTVIDDLSTGRLPNLRKAAGNPNFLFVRADVRDKTTMTSLVGNCDMVYHLAAAVGVQLIVDRPVHTIETNIHGTEVVLELANKFRRRVVVASTSEVYGKNSKVPFHEDDDCTFGPITISRWSYGCSKMIDEFLALAYHNEYGLETVVCRFFNTIGPRQSGQYGMVLPRFVRRALRDESLEVYGSGEQLRCFCNVSDVVNGLVGLSNSREAIGQVLNLGSNEGITINALALKVIQLTESRSKIKNLTYIEAYGRPIDDMMIRIPDISKAIRLIQFRPSISLTESILEIAEFERGNEPPGDHSART